MILGFQKKKNQEMIKKSFKYLLQITYKTTDLALFNIQLNFKKCNKTKIMILVEQKNTLRGIASKRIR